MAKSKESFGKREREKQRQKKKQDKQERKEEQKELRKEHGTGDMIAYVDEFGRLSSQPIDPSKKTSVNIDDIHISIEKKTAEEEPVKSGKVYFFNSSKGYGFIKEDDTQESYFVHVNDVSSPVKENDKVTFEIIKGPKGMQAVRVKKA